MALGIGYLVASLRYKLSKTRGTGTRKDHLREQKGPNDLVSAKEEISTANLSPCQHQAIAHVERRAKRRHRHALPFLQQRVSSLGFTSGDLTNCLSYIREDAPIVIHLTATALSKLLKDTHYRNLFETGTSGGANNTNARRKWESKMFGCCYDGNCSAFERPKYASLNFTAEYSGVQRAKECYGSFCLFLRNHVRQRATFYGKDTCGFTVLDCLGTREYYAHILNDYSNEDLTAAIKVANVASITGAASPKHSTYKEVQIHGEIRLASDIEALSVPGKELEASTWLKNLVAKFQRKCSCMVLWQGDLLESRN